MGRWNDQAVGGYKQSLINRILSGETDYTYGPGSPDRTPSDMRQIKGARDNYLRKGDIALPPEDYRLFTPAERDRYQIADTSWIREGRPTPRGSIERWYDMVVPESTPPQGYPFTGEAPSSVPYNVPPNENMYPSPIEQYNPAPNENMYPTPVEGTYNPTPYGPSDYPTPVENPIFNPAPQESQGYPSSVDYSNPAPSESIDYPTQVDFSNPAPNESTDYPTPVEFGNPAPNEDMVANPSDMYFTGDMGTSGGSAPSEPPMPTGSVPLPTSSSPPLQVINDLGYNPSYPYGSSGSGVPTQQGAGILGSLIGGGLGSLLIPGVGGIIGNKLGGMGARMLARFLQGQAMNRDQSGGTVVQPADQGGGSYDPFGGLPPGFVEGNRNYGNGPNEFTQTGGAPTFYNPAGYMGGSAPGGSFFGGQSNIFYGNPGDPNNGRFVPGMGPLDIPGGGNLGPLFGGGGGLSVLTLGSGGGRTGQGIYGLMLGSGSGAGGANKVSPLMWG